MGKCEEEPGLKRLYVASGCSASNNSYHEAKVTHE